MNHQLVFAVIAKALREAGYRKQAAQRRNQIELYVLSKLEARVDDCADLSGQQTLLLQDWST
jgi:hypothetical protein